MAELTKAEAEAEIRRLERETEGLKILTAQQDAENKKRMDELDTLSTGVRIATKASLEEAEDDKVASSTTGVRPNPGTSARNCRPDASRAFAAVGAADLHERGPPPPPRRTSMRMSRARTSASASSSSARSGPDGPQFEETFAALNAILSGPPSSPEQRRWLRGITLDTADPVCGRGDRRGLGRAP